MSIESSGTKEPLWTKNYILIVFNNLLMFLVHHTLFTAIPLFMQGLGSPNYMMGLSTTVFAFSALLFRPIFGLMIDKKGRQTSMLTGLGITMLALALYGFAETDIAILVLRALHGAGFSALSTLALTMVADTVPRARMAEGIGYSGIAFTVSTAIGPVIGIYLLETFGFVILLFAVIIMNFINIGCSFLLKFRPLEQNSQRTGGILVSFYEKSSVKTAIVQLVIALSFASVSTFIPIYGISRGIAGIGIFFTVFAAVALTVRIGTAKSADRYGVNIIFWPGLAALIISFVVLSFADTLSWVVIAAVFYGIGSGIATPMLSVVNMKLCSQDRRGAANAMLFAAMDIGIGFGALVWGGLSEVLDFTWVYGLSAVVVLIACLLYHLLLSKNVDKGIILSVEESALRSDAQIT